METIDPQALRKSLDGPEKPVLLDVLPAEAHADLRLPGSCNACVYEMAFLDKIGALEIPAGAPIVVIGSSSATREAHEAAERLRAAGYARVRVLAGGRRAWQEAGLPVEGARSREPWRPERSPAPANGTYRADAEKSALEWTGRNLGGRHFGTLRLAEGEFEVREGALARGAFEIDMKSIRVGDLQGDMAQMLVRHLESDDFFAVARFPTARLEIRAARPRHDAPRGAPNVEVEADLTLRGVRKPLRFAATVGPKGEQVALDAHFDVDRTQWDVAYGSGRLFDRLGMHVVDDVVSVQVRVLGTRT